MLHAPRSDTLYPARWPAAGAMLHPAFLCVASGLVLAALSVYAIDLAEGRPGAGDVLHPVARRQLVFQVAGVAAAALAAIPHYRAVSALAWPLLGASLALLVFLLLPFVPAWLVPVRNGTRGWIDLGPIDFQPSEVAKITFVLAAARYLRFRDSHRRFAGLLAPGLIACVPIGLIMLQPDLGQAILFVPALFAVLVAAGARLRHLTIIVLLAALVAPAAYPVLQPHQRERIAGLLDQARGIDERADTVNFQALTAQRLIGAGGVAGLPEPHARALIRHNALPADHNDMIFAVVCCRFGLLGGLAVLLLYVAWVAGALGTAARARDPVARLTAVGFAAFVAAQMVVNIGMNVGLLPIVGITLPFLSYGGSSLLTVWLMTGLLVGIARRPSRPSLWPAFEYPDTDDAGD